jgi:[glutamine synthetase] adenylyltransferase / [glutamine synthetase]-adenylyl-L-tyrosine phosphorylase
VAAVSVPRAVTQAGRLATLGFGDTAAAQRMLADELGWDVLDDDAEIVSALGAAPDPDLALAGLVKLQPDQQMHVALQNDAVLRTRLTEVLGISSALGDHLRRHPGDWRLLSSESDNIDGWPEDLDGRVRTAADPGELRVAYKRALLRLAARDITGELAIDDVMAGLADLAAAALTAALNIARSQLPPSATDCRIAVIAMGKCGGRELNYASDVDVIFVAEPAEDDDPGADARPGAESDALRTATLLASAIIRICSEPGPEGSLFPVDANLRPEGRSGPLVRTLGSHLAYYQRWAKTWEFQALLKARPVAGDADLGARYMAAVSPLVWQAAQRDDFVADVQAMRRRIVDNLPPGGAEREIKLGPGGLRDIEFAVQLLQLVHGRADETLRDPATLPALAALAAGGYVGRQDAASLAEAYRFLRVIEHLLQLRQLRRTHSLPVDPSILRQMGRALRTMRYTEPGPPDAEHESPSDMPGDPAEQLMTQWRQHAATVRQLHEKLFYRPLLDAVARLPGDVIRLTSQAATERLEALGYDDPAGALRHITALTTGVSRKAAIQRALLPALLGWFADAPRPDVGLLAFRQVSEALGGSPWYLRLLRDDANVAARLARVLASGRYATDLLLRAPEAVAMLADDALLEPRNTATLRAEAESTIHRHAGEAMPGGAIPGLLAIRRRELFRTAVADLLGPLDPMDVAAAIGTVTTITIGAALDLAKAAVAGQDGELPAVISVVAMGRFGGHEMSYGSDADVLFVYEPVPSASEEAATRAAHAVAEELRAMLARPGPDPPLHVDADLRPEGKQGPLVRTLGAYRAYYRRWARTWEVQALLRADPIAGDAVLGAEFVTLADEIRYPAGGMADGQVREIRRIKARMEAERMPRGVDPALHVKLGPGGLSDAEWVAQLLQLRYAGAVPSLRTTGTLPALRAASEEGLLRPADADALNAAWLLATRIRNAVMLATGRASDVLPTGQAELAGTARLLGYRPEGSQDLVQDWRRAARRARAVIERVFYG